MDQRIIKNLVKLVNELMTVNDFALETAKARSVASKILNAANREWTNHPTAVAAWFDFLRTLGVNFAPLQRGEAWEEFIGHFGTTIQQPDDAKYGAMRAMIDQMFELRAA